MMTHLHPALKWGLLATLALSAWALLRQDDQAAVQVVEANLPVASSSPHDQRAAADDTTDATPGATRPALGPAHGDPFARPVEAPAVAVPDPEPAIEVAPEPPPNAPAMTYRFLGRMTTPDGQKLIYLSKGDVAVPVSVGSELEDGYVVQVIREDRIDIAYPPTGAVLALQIPQQGDTP